MYVETNQLQVASGIDLTKAYVCNTTCTLPHLAVKSPVKKCQVCKNKDDQCQKAYTHQAKTDGNAKNIQRTRKRDQRVNDKHKTILFASAFTRCEWV